MMNVKMPNDIASFIIIASLAKKKKKKTMINNIIDNTMNGFRVMNALHSRNFP